MSVKGRPDLKVRVRQGKVDLTQLAVQGSDRTLKASPATKDPSEALLRLLKSPLPVGVLPLSFFAGYDLKSDKGFSLSIALQTAIEDAQVKAPGAGGEHRIDLAGMVLNTEGETVTSFAAALAVPPADASSGPRERIYSGALPMKPGLYQVRIAVRDSWTGRSASAIQWLDVPGLSESRIVLGSAFLAETSGAARPDIFDGNSISIRRRFRPSSQVSYFLHVYDLERKPLVYQTRLYRSNSIVSESGFQPLASPDAAAMVTGRLPLESLPPGGYTLEITVKDSSRSPVAQQVRFWIE